MLLKTTEHYGSHDGMTLEQWIEECDALMLQWCEQNGIEWHAATHDEQNAAFVYACTQVDYPAANVRVNMAKPYKQAIDTLENALNHVCEVASHPYDARDVLERTMFEAYIETVNTLIQETREALEQRSGQNLN